jgi:starch phosphorylase
MTESKRSPKTGSSTRDKKRPQRSHPLVAGDPEGIKRELVDLMTRFLAKEPDHATKRDWFSALAKLVRGYMGECWLETKRRAGEEKAKVVYYLSMEFLVGRSLRANLLNLGVEEVCSEALRKLGVQLEDLYDCECEAALGNGGLGRLAACVLEAMTTHDYPTYGYGIRYVYGMFRQRIEDGWQVEQPENWLAGGDPWEFPRFEVMFPIRFGGRVVQYEDHAGVVRSHWVDTDDIMALGHDMLVSGYGTDSVNSIRLWSAKSTREFDLRYFQEGCYAEAVRDKNETENLTRVLYPDDSTAKGRQLRLKQEYFFVSAALQDILAHYDAPYESLHERVVIQLNDTHPALAIPEMMRILVDVHEMDWEKAWEITSHTFAFTNHTLLPEALESWPVAMLEELLPRHLQIIYQINERFIQQVRLRAPRNTDIVSRVSLVGEHGERHIRMAHLAIVGSYRVNGVSRLHSTLLRNQVFADFDRLFPGRITSKTNGITPRRWLQLANPELSSLISSRIGSGWETHLERLEALLPLADDPAFGEELRAIKHNKKTKLAKLLNQHLKVGVDPSSMFDLQIKRIHEYKRQLLNVLGLITYYNRIRTHGNCDMVPRTVIFAGKAAPAYTMAKLMIKLINDVAAVINADPVVGELLKVAFVPNYDVSTAEDLIPAAELSQQISTAGTEASGTGNMKLALNGALTIGTRDGANIEIGEAVGEDNIFFFGLDIEEVARMRREGGYDPWACYHEQPELKEALDLLRNGHFSPDDPDRFRCVFDSLTNGGDTYMVLADFSSYMECQAKVDALYRDPVEWTRRAIRNIAKMGGFSCDRMVHEYADDIWNVKPLGSRKTRR